MTNSALSALNMRYGIAGQVSFKDGPGGLTMAEVANAHATATIALQGAHVMTFVPRGEQPLLWLSAFAKFAPGKSIRGGVPICWPWFGPHATESSFPGHGFARTVPWEVLKTEALSGGGTRLVLRIVQSDATRAQWSHPSDCLCEISIGRTLDIDLVTRNAGSAPIVIGDALHTYFQVSDVRQCAIRGLEDCPYLDKVSGGQRKQQVGAVTINAETDRIYLDSVADCVIEDPGLKRRIRISKRNSRSTVVWNPWIEKAAKMGDFGENGYLSMVCVESTNAADDIVTIPPGGEHRLQVRYGLEPLA
jgi:glucose-6-phosphate 1-epimerase